MTVTSYGARAGFATSMDIQMEKAMRKRTAVAMETGTTSSSSPSPSVSQVQSRMVKETSAASSLSLSPSVSQVEKNSALDTVNALLSSSSLQAKSVETICLEEKSLSLLQAKSVETICLEEKSSTTTADGLRVIESEAESHLESEEWKEGMEKKEDGVKSRTDVMREELQKFFNNFSDEISVQNRGEKSTAQEQSTVTVVSNQESMLEDVVLVEKRRK